MKLLRRNIAVFWDKNSISYRTGFAFSLVNSRVMNRLYIAVLYKDLYGFPGMAADYLNLYLWLSNLP
jgi:hypothetical protein